MKADVRLLRSVLQLWVPMGTTLALLSSCGQQAEQSPVVAQRYVHKYGYTVSKEEWDANYYPGQVISTMRDGVTIASTYEAGVLHGPTTYTYPNSQTVQAYYLYNQGNLAKEILYDIHGMPIRERNQLSPARYTVTSWYRDGTPLSIEEHSHDELVRGQYFTPQNELESWVDNGNGKRICRSQEGLLLSVDTIAGGFLAKRESYYPSGAPECIAFYQRGQLHGELQKFSANGEPLAVEEWVRGQLHGKSTYFKNGAKYLETAYLNGQKNGLEVRYLDGELIAQETLWENDRQHGPTRHYIDDTIATEWYYDGKLVSQRHFEELAELDRMVMTQVSPEVLTELR